LELQKQGDDNVPAFSFIIRIRVLSEPNSVTVNYGEPSYLYLLKKAGRPKATGPFPSRSVLLNLQVYNKDRSKNLTETLS